ncbi:hypothetical protein AALP_AA7G123500 [Arabis alpina]|uniref:Uncharacterized protein n=1 Tax=Arabis alpina TaxID=50452 RepID=A0A087GHK4_ARAAL|nr:hypothetical protein AALP_AA7G123500 [Arabis alpina]
MERQNSDDIMKFLDGMASSDDVLFGFLDEGNQSPEDYHDSGNFAAGEESAVENDSAGSNSEENRTFWQEQEQLLQAALYRTSSTETKIRQATKEVLKEVRSVGLQCVCRRPVIGGCRSCLRVEVSSRLLEAGYDCVISKSKWRSSHEIPAGEHEYLEIVDKSGSKKGEIRVVIELSFRAEFEMSRGSEEYKRLIGILPEIYVGKTERLRSLIKILCTAAKKCMKDKKMHMGPWRKHKYMQAKWLGTCERKSLTPVSETETEPKANQRVSMLKNGLFGSSSTGMGRPAAVAVV